MITAIEVNFKVVTGGNNTFVVRTPTITYDGADIKGYKTKPDEWWIRRAFKFWKKHHEIEDGNLRPKDMSVHRVKSMK